MFPNNMCVGLFVFTSYIIVYTYIIVLSCHASIMSMEIDPTLLPSKAYAYYHEHLEINTLILSAVGLPA